MKYVADKDGHWIPKEATTSEGHFVQGDIEMDLPGKHIGSRSQWREHLKRTDTIEMGHSDIKKQHEKWEQRKADHRESLRQAEKIGVKAAPVDGEIRERGERSRLQNEVANRLHGRPAPPTEQLIKITLEAARDLARRR